MKFSDLKKEIENGNKIEELINFKYVPIMSQKLMTDNIKSLCLHEDNNTGFLSIDYYLKNIFELIFVLVNYTDIELDLEIFKDGNINIYPALEVYDYFKEHRLDELIFAQNDCKSFISLLDNEIQQELNTKNNIGCLLSQVLNNISNKLPSESSLSSLVNEIPTLLNTFAQSKKRNYNKKVKE